MHCGFYKLKYVGVQNNFCHLSTKSLLASSAGTDEQSTLKVSKDDDSLTAYVSCQINSSLHDNEVGLSRLFAQGLGFDEDDTVMVTRYRNLSTLSNIVISPESVEDYEILEILAGNIETTLLNQIRVVSVNQKFIIWVTDSLHFVAKVEATQPVNPGRLDNFTQVAIAYPSKVERAPSLSKTSNRQSWNFEALAKKIFGVADSGEEDELFDFRAYDNLHCPVLLRLHPIEDLGTESCSPFDVYVYEHHLPARLADGDSSKERYFKMKFPIIMHNFFGDKLISKTLIVRLHILERSNKAVLFPTAYVHSDIFANFGIQNGSKALLLCAEKLKFSSVSSIEIVTSHRNYSTCVQEFKRFLAENEETPLNANFRLSINSDISCLLNFNPSSVEFCVGNADLARNCPFKVSDVELSMQESDKRLESHKFDYFVDLGNAKSIVNDAMLVFTNCLNCEDFSKGENVLIVGKLGSGKTILTKILEQKMISYPVRAHVERLNCKTLKGKSLESLQKIINSTLSNLVFYQPSILIFDDLHIVCESTNTGDELTPEDLYFNRVSEMLSSTIYSVSENYKISVLATVESMGKLHRAIFSARGQHLFKTVLRIENLNKTDRERFLRYSFDLKNITLDENVDFEQLSLKTEGFVVQDLTDVVEKTIFESIQDESPIVSESHLKSGLAATTLLSLKDVNLHSAGDRDFSDIGGLGNVKKVMVESFLWPLQYPNIFDNIPLRLQSGLLLYGPPGTGKTILAGAAAKQYGLRLISVKGPELLSKYIGASEQAVRNVFEKAQSAKPCILFFDEFDSLAPRRGHDSTGVTDRVVNQFLTQLDGVESLSGVCVLAATSRPDLLDPALLRPGRLDKQVFCKLPDEDERLEILKALSKEMVLDDGVTLKDLACRTEHFSGADLQAVLCTAQLTAIDEALACDGRTVPGECRIYQAHMEKAIETTRPSLTRSERNKYEKIYDTFRRKDSEKSVVRTKLTKGQRLTLA